MCQTLTHDESTDPRCSVVPVTSSVSMHFIILVKHHVGKNESSHFFLLLVLLQCAQTCPTEIVIEWQGKIKDRDCCNNKCMMCVCLQVMEK